MYLSMYYLVKIQNGRQMCKYVSFWGMFSQRGEYKPLLFLHCWTTQGPEYIPVDQVTAAALVKYGQNVHDVCAILVRF